MKIFVSLLGVGALCALSLLSGCSNKTNSQVADSKGTELSQSIRNYAGDIQSAIEWHFKYNPASKGKFAIYALILPLMVVCWQ